MCESTVVIPTFNRGHLVHRAIESALNQTVKPRQIVVVDDGSTDNTAGRCAPAIPSWHTPSIEYVCQPNSGAAAARNHGVRLARHPWTAFLDSDDYWVPNYLEKIGAAIESTSGAAAFYFTDMGLPGGNKEQSVWEKIGFRFSTPFFFVKDATDWMLSQRQPSCLPCSVFNTRRLIACGAFDPGFQIMEDTELFCRLGIRGPVCAVNLVGGNETADDNPKNRLTGILHSYTARYWEHECMLWRSLLSRFPDLKPSHRRSIHYCLATAHWRLTRLHWRSGHLIRSSINFLQSVQGHPSLLVWLLRNGRSDGWQKIAFAPCRAD